MAADQLTLAGALGSLPVRRVRQVYWDKVVYGVQWRTPDADDRSPYCWLLWDEDQGEYGSMARPDQVEVIDVE